MNVAPGYYHDAFEPSGPVEVIGEAVCSDTGLRRIVVRVPGSEMLELVRPWEFFRQTTVKETGPDGPTTSKIDRYVPVLE